MKKMKKLVSFLLTMVMVLSMAITGFAETYDSATDNGATTGSITINDAVAGQTYKIYQILDLESYNKESNAYAYKATTNWGDFINSERIKDIYVEVDDQGYVSWITTKTEGEGAAAEAVDKTQTELEAEAAEFAKLAQAYAEKNSIEASKDPVKADSENVTFTELELGYYLVDTTLGTLCSLDTTNPTVEMYEKNGEPTITKEVQEDSGETDANEGWGEEDTAQIGQTVTFKTTVYAKKGAQNYVVHDAMSAGLTFTGVTSVVASTGSGDSAEKNNLTKDTDYSVKTTELCSDEKNESDYGACDFHVVFTQTYLDSITEDTMIVITYTAILNEEAEIYDKANTNDTRLTYGDSSATEWQHTDTYTFTFDIVKTDNNLKLLNGAEFELYDAKNGGNKIPLVSVEDDIYRVATDDEQDEEGFKSAIIKAGKATVKGLDGDESTTYYLEETNAPDGYNKLAERVAVRLIKDNEDGSKSGCNLTTTMEGDTWKDGNGGIQITNKSGTELPSTGGTGTTIFYVLGGILVLAAGVLLVTRKRMNMEEE